MIAGPLLGALIGYTTNWVAIKMLFRPHTEKRLLGLKLPFTPGMIPKRRYILAKKTSRTIAEYLLTDETLIEHLCSENVKNNIEGIIDGIIDDAKKSEKTVGDLLLGDAHFNADAAAGLFSEFDFADFAKKLDKMILGDNRKVCQVLPDGIGDNINIWISENIRAISEKLIGVIESAFFENSVKPIVVSIIRQNVKGIASLFVLPESVCDNFRNGLIGYLKNPENDSLTTKRLEELLGRLMEAELSGLAEALADDKGRLTYALIEKLERAKNGGDAVFAEIFDGMKNKGSKWLADYLASIKIGFLVSQISDKQMQRLKAILMSGYGDFVKNSLPPVLEALNISAVIEKKINEFEMKEAEDIVVSVVEKELKAITYFGGLLGFAIGFTSPLLAFFGV